MDYAIRNNLSILKELFRNMLGSSVQKKPSLYDYHQLSKATLTAKGRHLTPAHKPKKGKRDPWPQHTNQKKGGEKETPEQTKNLALSQQ